MFLLLESGMAVHMDRVLALVRDEDETAVYLRDGSVMATGFTPATIDRRSRKLFDEGKERAAKLRQGGKKNDRSI